MNIKLNPWGILIGDIVTAEEFTGVYRVQEITEEKKYGEAVAIATMFQVFTVEGKPVKLNRPSYSDMRKLKPAFFLINSLNERIENLKNFVSYLEQIKNINRI